jgi:hypothetical protein
VAYIQSIRNKPLQRCDVLQLLFDIPTQNAETHKFVAAELGLASRMKSNSHQKLHLHREPYAHLCRAAAQNHKSPSQPLSIATLIHREFNIRCLQTMTHTRIKS